MISFHLLILKNLFCKENEDEQNEPEFSANNASNNLNFLKSKSIFSAMNKPKTYQEKRKEEIDKRRARKAIHNELGNDEDG